MSTLWHGRFASGPSDALLELNSSLSYDFRLYNEDIDGSVGHVRMLVEVGLLRPDEGESLLNALEVVRARLAKGEVSFQPTDEDIHTVVERLVTELAGEVGAKLHTGRSRNDQVATDLRLYVKKECRNLCHGILALQYVLLELATQAQDAYLPGYTHLQRAQPVALGHHFAAHAWTLSRDFERLLQTYGRADVSPLGAGALAGSSLPLDPEFTAKTLGFSRTFDNSLDAVSDRDFVADLLYALSLLGVHLSRIGEEVVLWASEEFGFLTLDDAFSTGSSMMPQKKNADIAELARGKAGRLLGNLTGFLSTLKGLPLAYNKDLQEDKEPLFDSVTQMHRLLIAIAGMLQSATYNTEAMARAADHSAAGATDLADYLVIRGMPFRQAHEVVAQCVRESLDHGVPLADVVVEREHLGPEAAALLASGVSVTRKSTYGSGGLLPLRDELERLSAAVTDQETKLASLHA